MQNIKKYGTAIILFLLIIWIGCDADRSLDKQDDSDAEPEWIEGNSTDSDTTTYYVATDGDDNNIGTDLEQAFRSLSKAFKIVKPGGKISIAAGIYTESIGPVQCGNKQDSILIQGAGLVILDGRQENALGIFCEECSGLIFDNLIIQNFTDIGIGASYCENMTFRNLTIKNNGHQVQLKSWELEGYGLHVEESTNIYITDNEVFQNGPKPQYLPDYLLGTGINTYHNSNIIIRRNKSFRNTGGGFLIEDSEYVLFENNEAFENDCDASEQEWWDAGLWVDGGKNVIVKNNIFYDNLGAGIELSDEDNQNPTGYVLENNICTGNYFGIFIWNFGTSDWPDELIIQQSDNQFTDNTREDVWIEATY